MPPKNSLVGQDVNCDSRVGNGLIRLLSFAVLIMVLTPFSTPCQERWEKVRAFRVRGDLFWLKGDDGKPLRMKMSWARDSRGHMRTQLDSITVIFAAGYFYLRVSDDDVWRAISPNTAEALIAANPDWFKALGDPSTLKNVLLETNMRFKRFRTLAGGMTKQYDSIDSIPLRVNDDETVLLNGSKFVSPDSQRLRKVTVTFSDPQSKEKLGLFSFYFFAYNSHFLIRAPKLRDEPENPDDGRMFLSHARCESSENRKCRKNEMIIQWHAYHIRNAAGVILTREDYSTHRVTKMGSFRQPKGSINDTLCEPAVYRVIALDGSGRKIPRTKTETPVTGGSLVPCR